MIALFDNRNEIVYFDTFGVEHIPEEIKEFINRRSLNFSASQNKNIKLTFFEYKQTIQQCVVTFA